MKKEASGKKGKWLWLVLGIVALLAVVGVVLVLIFGGGGDKNAAGGRAELYWNVDKDANTDRDTGLSIRQPAEDGNFYVRFAHDGEQVEIPVADKKLVNYIDSLTLMNLVLDNDGYVVDVKPLTDVASVIGESLYVQSVNGNTIVANSSIMMNGRKVTIEMNDEAGIYNVSGKGEFVGEAIDPSKLNPMDTISAYGTLVPEDSEEDPVLTHVFVTKKPAESKVYWRAEQFYNSTDKVTTREPDENGVYTIDFWVDGEYVSLKCKDKDVVTFIDAPAYYWCHFGLEFDEEGYIIEALDSFLASRTLLQCERYDITEIYDDGSYVATSLIKNNGAFVQGTIGADCPIWEVSKLSKAEGEPCRRIDSLKMGDRVCIWTDTNGTPVLVYVAHRLADSPAYWNVTRSYDSAAGTTSRELVNGYYEIEMVEAGKTGTKVYRTKDIELATAIDKPTDRCVGLKIAEDGKTIQYVYDMECVFGYTYFCRGYFVQDVTGSVATYLSPAYSGYSKNGVLAADAKVWNVSGHGTMGEETTLQYGDTVYACKTPIGEIANAYVSRRVLGINTAYWNITRMWDATTKTTTRVPDEEGYYVFEMAHKGEIVTVKTKNIEFANAIDSQNTHRYFSLLVNSKGIITEVNSAYFCLGGSRYASHYVIAVDGNKITTLNSSKTTQYEIILGDNCQIYNVSTAFKDHIGERTTLQVGDYITLYRDVDAAGTVLLGWVRTREVSKMAWPVDPQYDSTNACTKREPVDGWYYIPLAIDGEVKTYKTKSKAVASGVDSYTSAFGVEIKGDEIVGYTSSTYVKNVKGAGLTNYVVSKDVTGSKVNVVYTLGSADKTGKTESFTMSSKCKVYDVSPTAEKFGAPVKLKEGDTIRTYVDDDKNTLFVYVISHCTREGGYKSLCDHCGEVVFWNAYSTSANAVAYDCHYYLPADLNITSQIRVYNSERDFETVLDLNGHTICRNGGRAALVRYGDTFTIIDCSKEKDGQIMSRNNTSNGGVIMVSTDGILNLGTENGLFGGTVTMDRGFEVVKDEKTGENTVVVTGTVTSYAENGALISNSSVVNMYDAVLTDGIAASREDGATGGGVTNSGTFNMYGGEIRNCWVIGWHDVEVIDPTTKQPVKERKYYTGAGGNVYNSAGSFNMFGGRIYDGLASRGGNVNVAGGTFTMTGGDIANGIASRELGKSTDARGGNIFSTGNVYLKGGKVYGGVTDGNSYGGNLMSTGLKDCIYISGDAHISGGTAIKYTTNEDGTKTASTSLSNIYLMYSNLVVEGGLVDMGDWTSGSVIGSTGTNTGGYSTVTVAGGTVKGNISLSGGLTTIEKDASGQTYYVSGDDKINVYFREDGSAYTLNSKNKEVAFYPNYRTELTLTGGKVEGTVSASTARKITVSGNPVVNLLKVGGNLLNVGVMTEGANVTIDKVGVFTYPLDKAAVDAAVKGQYIKSTNKSLILGATAANELKIYHPDAVAGYCEHCDSTVDWIPTAELPTADGHYALTGDVVVSERAVIDSGLNTVLDLAGHTVSAATETVVDADGVEITQGISQIFYVKGNLSILDTSEGKTGIITGGRGTRGGNIYVYSGTLTLYGGTIANGVADNALGTTSTNGRGGNIFSNGNVILKGGAVIGGKALNGSGYGGNICVTGLNAGVTIEGNAVVAEGKAKTGGNIYTMYSNLNVSGGEIIGGGVFTSGTNTGGFTTVNISGGKFSDGTLEFSGGVTTVNDGEEAPPYADYRTALTISGGEFDCIVNASKVQNFNVSGAPVVKSLTLDSGVLMTLGEMKDGAKINLASEGTFTTAMASKAVAESYIKYFGTKGEDYLIEVTEDFALSHSLDMSDATFEDRFCVDHNKKVEFVSFKGSIFENYDHYYLTEDLQLTGAVTIPADRNIVIDLNGHTLTAAENTRAFYLNGTLRVQDSSEAKSGVITGGTATRGGNIYVNGGAFYLYSGTVAGGVADNDLGSSTTNGRGGNIFAAAGEIHLLGGAVVDGMATNGSGYGGNICATGLKTYLYISGDAVVSGGNAKTGGNVYLMYSNMVMEGGSITGGVASGSGANICTNGTSTGGRSSVTITAGTISNGSVVLGGSVKANTEDAYADYRTVVNVSGGNMDCEFSASAYEFKLSGAPVFTDLTLSGTSLIAVGELSNGASVALNETSGEFTTAFASKEAAEAAAAYFHAQNSAYDIVVNDKNALAVNAVSLGDKTKVIFCEHCGAEVEFQAWLGAAIEESGHYYLYSDISVPEQISVSKERDVVIDLNGHKITADGGRAFSVSGSATLSIMDSVGTGEITGGKSGGGRGGNIYATSGNLHIYGGKIYGGTAATGNNSGNDIAVYNGEFTVSGNAQIGQAYETGYAVFLFSCTKIDVVDSTITGGLLLRSLTNFDLQSSLNVDTIGLWSAKFQSVEARTDSNKINVKVTNADNADLEGAFTAVLENASAAVEYFNAPAGHVLVVKDNVLYTEAEGGEEPPEVIEGVKFLCKHCGQEVTFTEWTGAGIAESGHYYLSGDVALTESIGLKNSADVVIELNGHKITANGCRAFYITGSATLSVQDSVGTGEITGGTSTGRGGNIYASGGNLHLYGGKIYGGTSGAELNNSGNDIAVYNGAFSANGNVQIGQAYESGYAAYLFNNTALDIKAATITGGALVRGSVSMKLSSSFNVDTLVFYGGSKLSEVEARTGEKITVNYINGSNVIIGGVFTDELENAAAAAEYFKTVAGYEIVVKGNTLEMAEESSSEPTDPTDPSTEPTEPSTEPSEPAAESCPHCAGAEWTAWDGTTTSSGHYYLTGDVQLAEMLIITSSSDTVIDLRGFTITAAENLQTFRVNGTFSVVDTSEAQTGKITGGVALPNSSTLLCRGGNICVNGGDFYLYSGSIVDGVADNRGGNIYVTGQGSINILGGTVSGGSVSKSGGANIFVNYSTLNISGGQIISEEANTQPNICATGYNEKNCVLNISGGEIKGSKIGLEMYSTLSEVTISGGTIEGQTIISAKGVKFAISGKPVIADLSLSNDAVITEIGTLETGASIKVGATSGKFTAELADAAAVAGYFDAVDAAYDVAADAENKYLEIVADPNAGTEPTEPSTEPTEPSTEPTEPSTNPNLESCPHCDGAEWVALDLSALTDNTLTAGHYYVPAGGIQLTARLATKASEEIVIDLRGETITAAEGDRSFYVYGTLTIVDTSAEQTGKIVGSTYAGNCGNIYVTTNAVLNLYGGTITGGTATRGGNLYIASATFNMYGGVVENGVADNALGTTNTNGRGGNIFATGEVNLYGGTISGGKTVGGNSWGGNIMFSTADKLLTVSDKAVITDGQASTGSNIYLMYSKMVMTGGEIANGGVYLNGTDSSGFSSLDISGGVIAAVETKLIDELKVSGTAVIKKLTLADGHVVTVGALAEGASIVLNEESGVFTAAFADAAAAEAAKAYFDTIAYDKTVVVNAENALEVVEACACGCKAPASTIEWKDANAYIAELAAAGKDTIDESVHLKLSADLNAGEIYGAAGKQILPGKNTACDVTIDLNGYTWSTVNTRAFYVYANSTLTVLDSSEAGTGKIVSTGKKDNTGGVLAIYGNFNLRSGTVALENPVALTTCGVVYVNATNGVFNMYGGTITGGSVASSDAKDANGGNVYIYNGTFNMYGGSILDGKAVGTAERPSYGGNLIIRQTATVNLFGGTISGGSADFGADVYVMTTASAGAALNISGTNVAGEVYVPSALATVTVSGTAVIGELELAEDAIVTVGELTEGASIAVNKTTEFTGALEDPDSVKDYFTGMEENSGVKVTADNKLIITTGCVCGCGTPSDEVVWEDAAAYLAVLQATDNGTISESVHLKLSADLDITALYGKNKQISLNPGEGTSKVTIDLNGYTWSSNHRLYVYAGAELTIMDSSEAKTGTMTSTGSIASGRVIINYGTINLLSGTLTMTEEGAVYVKAGGVVYQSSGTFNMYGGAIINGKVEDQGSTIGAGGNVNIRTGEFNIYGGTISGGVGTNGYNIYVGSSAKLNIYNDSVVVGNEGDDTLGIYKA